MIMLQPYPQTAGGPARVHNAGTAGWVIGRLALLLVLSLAAGCGTMPAPDKPVSFHAEVYPILQANCHACHLPPAGEGYRRTGLNMRTYADLMRGTRFGPVIVPGDPGHSILVMLVEGRADPALRMPYHKAPLRKREIEVLGRWIEQGALDN